MLVRTICAAVAGVLAFAILAQPAAADHRKRHRARLHQQYYSGPDFIYGVPGIRLLFGDYAMTEEEYDALYGTSDEPDTFDENYYEPKAIVTKKPRKKPDAAKRAKPSEPVTTASVSKLETLAPTKTDTKSASADTATKKAATAPKGLSCDKAGQVVADFGFTTVKPQTCTGKIYAFAATRDGSNFSIKLDSATGELTEVKKLQ
jgi:hypothetical protein